jgi:hypothetical protein
MDKDRVEGAAHRVKGAVKEAVGKVTGDAKHKPKEPPRRRRARCKTPSAARKTPFANP